MTTYDTYDHRRFIGRLPYTWDSENRLLSVTDGTTTNTFTYDGQHRRVTKRTTVSGMVTKKSHCLYDGWSVIEERTNYDTTSTFNLSTFALTRTLTWGTDLSGSLQGAGGVGGLLMAEEISGPGTTAYHYHYDGNGNVTEITDASGNPAATYRYDAFGNTLVSTGTYATTNKYRFSTKPLDAEIASAPLYYYGYRYYDPITGRWPSRDPIQESGGLNLYGFVGNDGLNKWDLLGMLDDDRPEELRKIEDYGDEKDKLDECWSCICVGSLDIKLEISSDAALEFLKNSQKDLRKFWGEDKWTSLAKDRIQMLKKGLSEEEEGIEESTTEASARRKAHNKLKDFLWLGSNPKVDIHNPNRAEAEAIAMFGVHSGYQKWRQEWGTKVTLTINMPKIDDCTCTEIFSSKESKKGLD